MVYFMMRGEVDKNELILEDFVEMDMVKKVGKLVLMVKKRFGDKVVEFEKVNK